MKKSFINLAKKYYNNPHEWHPEEFNEDLKSFGYLKNLITRYINGGENIHLTLNRIILICNLFTPKGARELCYEYLDENLHPIINSYLLYLDIIPAWQINVKVDAHILRELHNIFDRPNTHIQSIPEE